jgi:CMP-N,N'-diacetyllegionaminic acid synthase
METRLNSNVIAIVPARSQSKGIRHKNLADLGGFPLIAFSIAAARMAAGVDRVIVSTDSEEYAEVARSFGADVPFLRPDDLSGDTSTDRDFMLHAMEWLRDHEGQVPEYWVHLRPTTPLRDPAYIDAALVALKERPECTALRSGHVSPESPMKWFRRNSEGLFTALNSDETQLDRFNLPRQSFEDVYIPDGYVDVVRSSLVMNAPAFHGDRVLAFQSPACTEVDSLEELELLRYQIGRTGSKIVDFLNQQTK